MNFRSGDRKKLIHIDLMGNDILICDMLGLEFVMTSLEEAEFLASTKDGTGDLIAATGHIDDG